MVKTLAAALTGERKSIPQWSGQVENLRSRLRSLAFWELDNNIPRAPDVFPRRVFQEAG